MSSDDCEFCDSLRLELEAERYAHRKDNEYFVGVLSEIRSTIRNREGLFSSRCLASVESKPDTYSMCGLKLGHEGPHEPIPIRTQIVLSPTPTKRNGEIDW